MYHKICCFTGHRDIPPEQFQRIAGRLEETVRELTGQGVDGFWAGGALGFDTLAARTVLRLREEYPHIKLFLALPCLSQTRGWKCGQVQTYEAIKESADEVVYVSREYTRGCMHQRNRYLVDHSGVCVCYLTKDTGGTAYTVEYARKKGLSVINLGKGGAHL